MTAKKFLLFFLLVLAINSFSFAQIFRGEGEGRTGTVAISLHYVEFEQYRFLLRIDNVNIFLSDGNIDQLKTVLERFGDWELLATAEQISLTRTIDSITFNSFYYDHSFIMEPLILYLVFTGGPLRQSGMSGAFIRQAANDSNINGNIEDETQPASYWLFFDTSLERIVPFRLSSETVQELHFALSPENLAEAWYAHERQRALEALFQ
jgi:hypothetical protein